MNRNDIVFPVLLFVKLLQLTAALEPLFTVNANDLPKTLFITAISNSLSDIDTGPA